MEKVLPADLERFILLESGGCVGVQGFDSLHCTIGIHNDLSQIDCN